MRKIRQKRTLILRIVLFQTPITYHTRDIAMPARKPRKLPSADLRLRYKLFLEIGTLITLLLLILAFKINLEAKSDFNIPIQGQEVVQMEEIIQTNQEQKPPPPPRPPVPVEVPDDEVFEDVELDLDVFMDIDEPLDIPPPPPAEEVEEEPEAEIFFVVEEMPELIGGLRELQQKIEYPQMAKMAGVEGRVTVQFVVDEDGSVTDAIVLKGIGAGCDEEALRAVLSSKFKPGKQRGKPVKVKMSLPVTFKLR